MKTQGPGSHSFATTRRVSRACGDLFNASSSYPSIYQIAIFNSSISHAGPKKLQNCIKISNFSQFSNDALLQKQIISSLSYLHGHFQFILNSDVFPFLQYLLNNFQFIFKNLLIHIS